MKKLLLFKANGSWVAEELVNGKPSPSLVKYFGTHVLPTAFTDEAPAEQVLSEIKELNQDASVELKGV